MNFTRAIISGVLIWLLIFSAFIVLFFIPGVKDSPALQGLIVGLLILPIGSWGTSFYYQKGKKEVVFPVAVVIAFTALVLDAMITVPFIEIPFNGRGHVEFFTAPLFWILFTEIVMVVCVYWARKVKPLATAKSTDHEYH